MIPTETILELVTFSGDKVYLFPDRRGSSILSAESRLISSVRHTGDAFLAVHVGKDRNTDIRYINSSFVTEYKKEVSKVPASIQALYVAPADETDAEKSVRVSKIKNYFEN